MKRPHLEGERFDARDVSNPMFTASLFAASVGMIWDLATGHVSAFDRMLSNYSDDDGNLLDRAPAVALVDAIASRDSIAQWNRTDA